MLTSDTNDDLTNIANASLNLAQYSVISTSSSHNWCIYAGGRYGSPKKGHKILKWTSVRSAHYEMLWKLVKRTAIANVAVKIWGSIMQHNQTRNKTLGLVKCSIDAFSSATWWLHVIEYSVAPPFVQASAASRKNAHKYCIILGKSFSYVLEAHKIWVQRAPNI